MAEWERDPGGSKSRPGVPPGAGVESATRRAGEDASRLGAETSNKLRDTANELKATAEREVESRKADLADRVEGVAESVRHSADELRDREGWLADLMERGSDELAGFAQSVRSNNLGQMVSQVEGFARRQPVLFTGISVALGFALARVVQGSVQGATRGGGDYGQRNYGTSTHGGSSGSSDWQSSGTGAVGRGGYGSGQGSGPGGLGTTQPAAPRGTEMRAHVAGPELPASPYREGTGAAQSDPVRDSRSGTELAR